MSQAKIRKWLYFRLMALKGQPVGTYYQRFLKEDDIGIPQDTTTILLSQMISHCKRSVPYYREIMRDLNGSFHEDPGEYLRGLPILTKEIIRKRFDDLKSNDLAQRKWYFNASGGSTGEPITLVQDWEYASISGAIKLLYSKLAGREIGEPEIIIWGSDSDLKKLTRWKADFVNRLSNTTLMNAFRMTPERIRDFILTLNTKPPRLIVAYVDAIYEIARFAKRENLEILPQAGVITTAGTLHLNMRETIQETFQCRVFDRYGSREVGDIACERPGCDGLWVAPWGSHIEIVDGEGRRVPDGTEGEIVVTSLKNFAMPLIRYSIGDRGMLSPHRNGDRNGSGQVLKKLLGRTIDIFENKKGDKIHGAYFLFSLIHKDWISKVQAVQKSHSLIVFRIVRTGDFHIQSDLDETEANTKSIMGDDCEVVFEFVEEIPPSDSGKYRWIISELQNPIGK